jgi:1-acyl-sn-glycerol-3-phosphate acyltransferase
MIRRLLAGSLRVLTGVRRLNECPHGQGPAVFFANHSSHLDFAVVWSSLPFEVREQTSPAAAHDYWSRTKFRRWLALNVFQSVLIEREHVTRDNNPISALVSCVENGRSVLIFPEGTRRTDGEVGEFKAGLYHLARSLPDVPLVPVHLENLHRLMPKGAYAFVPIIAQAHFRAPIRLRDGESKQEFLQRARSALLDEASTSLPH